MVNVHQVAVDVHMLVLSDLDSCIGRLGGFGTWGEGELGKQAIRGEIDLRDRLGGELGGIGNEYFLDGWMRRLDPVWS